MKVARLETTVYCVPTDRPEADGTFAWDSTTMVLVEAVADSGARGLGYTYGAAAAAPFIRDSLSRAVVGCPVDDVRRAWGAMIALVRNVGRPGIAATAISAVDVALWDLKARVAGQPLFRLLGPHREAVPIYGSGGFTSYSVAELQEQLGGWVAQGIPRVKMKIGTDWGTRPEADAARVQAAREAIGPDAELFVDANGAYTVKQAIHQAQRFAEQGVSYFEEPVSSDHLEQLALVRQHVPMAVAAGEYAWDPWNVRAMLQAGAVDIQQADVTRCLGITGWLEAAEITHGFATPFSAHCAPSLHAQVGCAAPALAHVEYFYDHQRIERLFFDGAPEPEKGALRPDPTRPGLGLDLRHPDVARWQVAA
ncbi:MAG TPA: enolase C-terminal domain-like protein [Chloroflexota bacterium]|jgi:L-alanine-DL-glutamate epimerase-like enolase superfamily enzyme